MYIKSLYSMNEKNLICLLIWINLDLLWAIDSIFILYKYCLIKFNFRYFTIISLSAIFMTPDFLLGIFLSLVNWFFEGLLITTEFTTIFGASLILRLIFFFSESFDIFFKLVTWATLSSLCSETGVPPVISNAQICFHSSFSHLFLILGSQRLL